MSHRCLYAKLHMIKPPRNPDTYEALCAHRSAAKRDLIAGAIKGSNSRGTVPQKNPPAPASTAQEDMTSKRLWIQGRRSET